MVNILVVEDDKKLNQLFCTVLRTNGFTPIAAFDGFEALQQLDIEHIDLIITDIMMPNMDGYTFVQTLSDADFHLPILMITVKEDFEDKARGFDLGIDDYMVKPVDVKEMVLRVKALLRRAKILDKRQVTCGSTVINYDSMTVSISGDELLLPQKEFNLLFKLIAYPNKVFTRQMLMDEIWGMESETDERTVDVHINRLREKLKDSKDIQIITVRGLGYKAVRTE